MAQLRAPAAPGPQPYPSPSTPTRQPGNKATRGSGAHLEGNGVVVLAGVNVLGHAAVGAVGTDHQVHLKGGGGAHLVACTGAAG